jgi:hypothetical protein
MRKLTVCLYLIGSAICCYAQDNPKKFKVNQPDIKSFSEYLNRFDTCSLPFYTKNVDYSFRRNYQQMLNHSIPKNQILNYISNDSSEQGYYYTYKVYSTQTYVNDYSKYSYFNVCRFKRNNIFFTIYIKDQVDDSTLFYIASYNQEGQLLDKLRIYKDQTDNGATHAAICSDYTIRVCYYGCANVQKTNMTISYYKITDAGMFEFVKQEQKEGDSDCIYYMYPQVTPMDDDPIGRVP